MKTDDQERIFLAAVERMAKEKSAPKHTNPKRMKFLLVACALALICSLVGNVVQHSQNTELSHQVDALENQYSKKQEELDSLWKEFNRVYTEYLQNRNGANQ